MLRISWLPIFGFFFVKFVASADLNPRGTKCGLNYCKTDEFCSPYDSECRPCARACDQNGRNHELELCIRDCQEYLHDQRYVLRADLAREENLRGEVDRLNILVNISLTLTVLSIVIVILLLAKTYVKIDKIRGAFGKIFRRTWTKVKKTKKEKNVRDDVEIGSTKNHNVLKLAIPTISATVAPAPSTTCKSTPDTASTDLSGSIPDQDEALEYAYDNPAMSQSPESTQHNRSKKGSAF